MNSPGMRDTFLYCLGLLYWCFGQSLPVWVDVNFWHWFICVCVNLHVISLMCWSEDNLEKSVLFPTCGFQGSSSGHRAWQQVPLPAEAAVLQAPFGWLFKNNDRDQEKQSFHYEVIHIEQYGPSLGTTGSYSIRHSKGYHLFTKSPTTGCALWRQELGCTHV